MVQPLENPASIKALYDQVNAAISKILVAGQSATIEGNSVTRADLPRLYELKEKLANDYYAASGVSRRVGMDFRGGLQG